MWSSLLQALLAANVAAQKVVSWDIGKTSGPSNVARKSKRATITETLGNTVEQYFANVTIGTPGQFLQLTIDTGSSDVWMTQTGATYCSTAADACEGGTFDPTRSSTFKVVDRGGFDISYVDQTGSQGDYFTDNISVGGVSISGQQMGLARQTTAGTGIIGINFQLGESVCGQAESEDDSCQLYPSIIDSMVNQSKINSAAYSLWLNDLEANTGSILFGGVDTSKYVGDLVTLPIQPDSESQQFTSMTVAWTGFSIGTPNGEETNFVPQSFAQPAILDSGTTTLLFPDDLAQQVFVQFGAQYADELQTYVAPCYLENANATLDFQFGGASGPTIKVPVSEFLIDLTEPGQPPLKFGNGDVACAVGFEGAQGRPILLGDTFLRSAYVVYDLANKEVSIAQTHFNASGQNVQEIRAGTGGVPNVASTASASVAQTASGAVGIAATGASNAGGNSGAASSLSPNGKPPLAAFTTAPASSKGAAASLTPLSRSSEGFFLMCLVSAVTVLGSCLIWL